MFYRGPSQFYTELSPSITWRLASQICYTLTRHSHRYNIELKVSFEFPGVKMGKQKTLQR